MLAARVCDEFIATLDILTSLARLAGARLPELQVLDGNDVSPVLLGQQDAQSPRTRLYSLYGYKQNRLESFREGQWKLHLSEPPELYDLKSNVSEAPNLATQHPDVVKRLSEAARKVREATHAASNPTASTSGTASPIRPVFASASQPYRLARFCGFAAEELSSWVSNAVAETTEYTNAARHHLESDGARCRRRRLVRRNG